MLEAELLISIGVGVVAGVIFLTLVVVRRGMAVTVPQLMDEARHIGTEYYTRPKPIPSIVKAIAPFAFDKRLLGVLAVFAIGWWFHLWVFMVVGIPVGWLFMETFSESDIERFLIELRESADFIARLSSLIVSANIPFKDAVMQALEALPNDSHFRSERTELYSYLASAQQSDDSEMRNEMVMLTAQLHADPIDTHRLIDLIVHGGATNTDWRLRDVLENLAGDIHETVIHIADDVVATLIPMVKGARILMVVSVLLELFMLQVLGVRTYLPAHFGYDIFFSLTLAVSIGFIVAMVLYVRLRVYFTTLVL